MTRELSVNIHDTCLGIWQDRSDDPTFRSEIFLPLLRQMRRRGWKVTTDPETLKHYRTLSPNTRAARRGDLRGHIQLSGRVVELEFWAVTWPLDNRAGPKYDFNKMERLNYLDRLRLAVERRRIIAWLGERATVTVKDRNAGKIGRGASTAIEMINQGYAESWHSDKTLGRPVPGPYARNCTSADGETIEQGATVWCTDYRGRIVRGQAFYNINNMWWVVCGPYVLRNLGTHEIFCRQPENLRVKRNERARRAKLENELATAVRAMDFIRADRLKRVLFGDQPTWMIWARDHSAYYRSNYAGYTTDTISAGRYTREEAEREVRRVPHELEAHGPAGERLRFDQVAA